MTTTAAHATATSPSTARVVGRWLLSFLGFPAGGLAAWLVVGPVDTTLTAAAGGLVTGAVLGAVQAWAMRASRPLPWVLATATGLAVGLGTGATVVDFGTGLGDLVLQGALSGLGVGAAQAVVLARRLGPVSLVWPAYLAALWAGAWVVTTEVITTGVEDRWTVFGSSGAVLVALLTSVLPLVLRRRAVQDAA